MFNAQLFGLRRESATQVSSTTAPVSGSQCTRAGIDTSITAPSTNGVRVRSAVQERPHHVKVPIPAGTEIIDLTLEEITEDTDQARLAALRRQSRTAGTGEQTIETVQAGKSVCTVEKKAPRPDSASSISAGLSRGPRLEPSPFFDPGPRVNNSPARPQNKKGKKVINGDKHTTIPFEQLREKQWERSGTFRKPALHRSLSVPSIERQKRNDACLQTIINSGSPERRQPVDNDVEMHDANTVKRSNANTSKDKITSRFQKRPVKRTATVRIEASKQGPDPRQVVKVRVNETKERAAFKKLVESREKSDARSARRMTDDEIDREDYAKTIRVFELRSNLRAFDSDSDSEVPPSPCPRKHADAVFKVPLLPARLRPNGTSTKRAARLPSNEVHVHDDSDDEDFDPVRGTPDLDELWSIDRMKGVTNVSPPKIRNVGASIRDSLIAPKTTIASDEPYTLSSPTRKRKLPRGVQASLDATPTPAELGSPIRNKRRFVVDDEGDDDYEPERSQSAHEESVRVPVRMKVIPKPKLKGYSGGVTNETGHRYGNTPIPQYPQHTKVRNSEPRTPGTPHRSPSTPNTPKPTRYRDTQMFSSPVSPSPAFTSPFMSTAGVIREKRASRVLAEQNMKHFIAHERAMAAKSEETHMQECEALLSPSRPKKREAINQSVEIGVRDLSLAPSVDSDFSHQGWIAERQKGDRYQAKML